MKDVTRVSQGDLGAQRMGGCPLAVEGSLGEAESELKVHEK